MKRAWSALSILCLAAGIAYADSSNLEGGVFIAHHPPGLQYSEGENWCARYFQDFAIDSCSEQNNRIDTQGDHSVWFVLAAWSEPKEWRGVEFGFAAYDSTICALTSWGPCFPDGGGLEIPTAGWPGPNDGTTLTASGAPWSGNFLPVYYFVSYAYYAGEIPLGVHPVTGFGGTANGETPPQAWAAAAFGSMGILEDGVSACPEELDQGQGGLYGGGGESEPQDAYPVPCGHCAEAAAIVRFAPDVISFPEDIWDPPQYFRAPLGDAQIALSGLDTLLSVIGVESLATVAPGWRHLTALRSRDFQGNQVDLIDFKDVYRVTLDGTRSTDDAIATLRGAEGIEYAECDGTPAQYDMPTAPNDPYYPYTEDDACGQWYLNNDDNIGCDCDPPSGYPRVDLNAPQAWTLCYDQVPQIKAGTKIGILDQRCNGTHEDLEAFFDTDLSGGFVTGQWVGGPSAWQGIGHGTGMAAMAGAGTENWNDQEQRYVGIASLANTPASHEDRILVALMCNDIGPVGPLTAAVEALGWVCTYPLARGRIRVVNMSWGYGRWKYCHDLEESSPGLGPLRDACRNAFRQGVSLVASAGNDSTQAYPPQGWNPCAGEADTLISYPAAFPDYCLAVAAIGCRGQVHENPSFLIGSYIDLAGPGVGADELGMMPGLVGDTYTPLREGSSPASATMASAVALLLGAQSNLLPEDCYALLKASAISYGNEEVQVGAGMPQLNQALQWVTEHQRVMHDNTADWHRARIWASPHTVMLKNVPPEMCEEGGGGQWEAVPLVAFQIRSVVHLQLPEGQSVTMMWPRGVGSSGWRLLDHTLEGSEGTPYYDVAYYENWARLESADLQNNDFTFLSYTYGIPRTGQDTCWVPFDPNEQQYNLNYSYVVHDENLPSRADENGARRELSVAVGATLPARVGGVPILLSLPENARVRLGVYGPDGRLIRMLIDGAQLGSGVTRLTWDLKDARGNAVPSGVCFLSARAQVAGLERASSRTRLVVVR
jgi:hypothetical protein